MTSKAEFERMSMDELGRRLDDLLSDDTERAKFLDDLVGHNNWAYDPDQDHWLLKDKNPKSPAGSFIIWRRDMTWQQYYPRAPRDGAHRFRSLQARR